MDGCNKTVTRVKPCFQALQLFARLAFVMHGMLQVDCFYNAVTRIKICRSCLTSPCFKYLYRSEVYSCKLQETHAIRYSNR